MKDQPIKPEAMTPDQRECYQLFCDLVGGEHHISGTVFDYGRGIKCSVYSGVLATFDSDRLTRLVVMAHDRCIRVEICTSGPGRVGIVLHKRHTREGCTSRRHPTMEQALATIQPYRTVL